MLGICSGTALLGHRVCVYSTLVDLPANLPRWLWQFTLPIAAQRIPVVAPFMDNGHHCLLYFSYSDTQRYCLVVAILSHDNRSRVPFTWSHVAAGRMRRHHAHQAPCTGPGTWEALRKATRSYCTFAYLMAVEHLAWSSYGTFLSFNNHFHICFFFLFGLLQNKTLTTRQVIEESVSKGRKRFSGCFYFN